MQCETMKAVDFAEDYAMSREFEIYCDESHWMDNFSSDWCFERMQTLARSENVTLTGLDMFDYDKFFYLSYKYTEKGLS